MSNICILLPAPLTLGQKDESNKCVKFSKEPNIAVENFQLANYEPQKWKWFKQIIIFLGALQWWVLTKIFSSSDLDSCDHLLLFRPHDLFLLGQILFFHGCSGPMLR